jgi:hypothetical protein
MATPLTLETLVGYVAAEDVYVSYSEYYGDGTIYGRVDLLTPDGNPVKGEGKTKTDLMNAGVVLSETPLGSVTGDLVAVPNDAAPPAPVVEETPAPAPPAEETPAPPAEEVPAPAPPAEEAPASVPPAEETPAPSPPAPVVEETPAPAPPAEETPAPAPAPAPACKCSCNCCSCCSATPAPEDNRYTVSLSMMGFEVTREFTAKIDVESRKIYLS